MRVLAVVAVIAVTACGTPDRPSETSNHDDEIAPAPSETPAPPPPPHADAPPHEEPMPAMDTLFEAVPQRRSVQLVALDVDGMTFSAIEDGVPSVWRVPRRGSSWAAPRSILELERGVTVTGLANDIRFIYVARANDVVRVPARSENAEPEVVLERPGRKIEQLVLVRGWLVWSERAANGDGPTEIYTAHASGHGDPRLIDRTGAVGGELVVWRDDVHWVSDGRLATLRPADEEPASFTPPRDGEPMIVPFRIDDNTVMSERCDEAHGCAIVRTAYGKDTIVVPARPQQHLVAADRDAVYLEVNGSLKRVAQ
jgi:hypothetical protein